jgi:hypothetical protein
LALCTSYFKPDPAALITVMSTTYQLAQDVYACLADHRLVFSDLRADKYQCLNQANTRALLHALPGFQARDDTPLMAPSEAELKQAQSIVTALVRNGLLAGYGVFDKPVASLCIPVATCSLLSYRPAPAPRGHIGHWASFLHASLIASSKLRLQSFRRTLRGVENRKRRHRNSFSRDFDALSELVLVFHHLRPYYVREYLCRFDSLAMVEFLARYHHYPSWIFGVRSDPFAAHCWVQEGNCVLNDSVETLSSYTPIMVF